MRLPRTFWGAAASAALFFTLASIPASAEPYVIAKETFDITGRTRSTALEQVLGIAEGREFQTKEDLEAFAKDRARKLENLRVFKTSRAEIMYPQTFAAPAPDEIIPVTLKITIVDGAPIAIVPYAFYNSNAGFQGGALANAANVFGTMENVMAAGMYGAAPDENDNLRWSDPNFALFGTWGGIRVGDLRLFVTGSVGNHGVELKNRGVSMLEYDELRFGGGVGVTVPLTERVSITQSIGGSVSPQTKVTYAENDDALSYGPMKQAMNEKTEIAYEAFDWIGNFREGFKADAGVSGRIAYPRDAERIQELTATASASAYRILGNRFNPSARVSAFAKTGKPAIDLGEHARGILDMTMRGNEGVFVNTGVQTRLFRVRSAELHLSPTLDFAWAFDPDADDYRNDWGFGTGAELILVFDSMKNLPIKLGCAWDLRPENRLGDENRYEIDFNFSFTY